MEFTNEFLKFLVADIVNLCDEEIKSCDDMMEHADRSTSQGLQSYFHSLGKWSFAGEIRAYITDRLGRESLKKEKGESAK